MSTTTKRKTKSKVKSKAKIEAQLADQVDLMGEQQAILAPFQTKIEKIQAKEEYVEARKAYDVAEKELLRLADDYLEPDESCEVSGDDYQIAIGGQKGEKTTIPSMPALKKYMDIIDKELFLKLADIGIGKLKKALGEDKLREEGLIEVENVNKRRLTKFSEV